MTGNGELTDKSDKRRLMNTCLSLNIVQYSREENDRQDVQWKTIKKEFLLREKRTDVDRDVWWESSPELLMAQC